MVRLHTVVIDDEQNARSSLTASLNRYCPDVVVTGEADSVQTGFQMISTLHPDLIFLDIKLGDGTGFDLLKKLDPAGYRIIFVTAYDDYAIKAFKFNAVDYLLKPVDPGELKEAVTRVLKDMDDGSGIQRYMGLVKQMEDRERSPDRLALKTQTTIHFVPVEKIIRCQAEEGYTRFFIEDNSTLLVSHPLQEYEGLLDIAGFYRVHQSHLINRRHVRKYDRVKRYFVMSNHDKVPLSSRRNDILARIFQG
jgi:two-component system LytT family response regulator